jgi:hypothetical protein
MNDRSPAVPEYLTAKELAARLGYAVRTVRKKMHDGTWQKGLHWFQRAGSRPLFSWSSIVEWLRQGEPPATGDGAAYGPDIPRARRGRPHALTFVKEQSIPLSHAAEADGAPTGVSRAQVAHGAPRGDRAPRPQEEGEGRGPVSVSVRASAHHATAGPEGGVT